MKRKKETRGIKWVNELLILPFRRMCSMVRLILIVLYLLPRLFDPKRGVSVTQQFNSSEPIFEFLLSLLHPKTKILKKGHTYLKSDSHLPKKFILFASMIALISS